MTARVSGTAERQRTESLLSGPALPSLLVFIGMILAGFAAMVIGWRVAARTLDVATQLPAIVSGGVGGLVLVIIGTGLFLAQAGRARSADDRADADELLDRVSEVVQALRAKRGAQ
jgi:hypothetical protein